MTLPVRIYNRCGKGCPHDIDEPYEALDPVTRRRVPDQSPDRLTWENRRDKRAAAVYVHQFAALGKTDIKTMPGRPTTITRLDFSPDDARICTAGELFVIPCEATSPGKNFIVVRDPAVAAALLVGNPGRWCLASEELVQAELDADVEDHRVKAEKRKAQHDAQADEAYIRLRGLRIDAVRAAGHDVKGDVLPADLDLLWMKLQRGDLRRAIDTAPSTTAAVPAAVKHDRPAAR